MDETLVGRKEGGMNPRSRTYFLLWLGMLLSWGCGPATRAMVHEEDCKKIFPWPRNSPRVVIRVKPQTSMARYFLAGSYQEVEVDPSTTFFITDELSKQFAYTPSRSPIRRLSTIKAIQIRWPMGGEGSAAGEKGEQRVDPVGGKESGSSPGVARPSVKPSAEEEEEEEE